MISLRCFLFLLFPITAFAAGGINTTTELLAAAQPVNTECATAEFNNALIENDYMVSESDDRETVRDWIYDILQSPEALGAVLSCPEIADADETATLFMPIKYTFPGGREITINYETQPKVLEQRFLLASKTELPTDDPNPEISSTDPHATWVNTDPAWYAIMVTQSGALRDFVGPDKNNTISMKWIENNIDQLYPQNMDGWCSTKVGMGAKLHNTMVHDVIRNHTADMEDDDNNYYIAGDRNLKWISITEITIDVALTIATWGGWTFLSGAAKGARAAKIIPKLKSSLRTLLQYERVQNYLRHSLQIAKYTKEIDNMTDMAKYIRNIDKLERTLAKTAQGSKKYEKIMKQLEAARKLKADNMWKLGQAGQGIDKVEDIQKLDKLIVQNRGAIADIEKEMATLAKNDKNVAEYAKQFNELENVIAYSKQLKAIKNARTGNIITRTWQGLKNARQSAKAAYGGGKTLDRASKVARQASKSGRARDWLFHSSMRNAARVTRVAANVTALSFVVELIGGFYDWTTNVSDEFTNGIEMNPLLLLSADSLDEYDNVVNYGMWLMWSGDTTSVADDDAAYLQAMDFAQKFYQDLTQVQNETGRHACDVDIYVVRPVIRNPNTDSQELYLLVMNDEPWSPGNAAR